MPTWASAASVCWASASRPAPTTSARARIVILAETLLGKGYDLRIYDRNVLISRLTGANKAYIEQQIPHLAALLCDDVDELLAHSELLVVGNNGPEFVEALTRTRPEQTILDLVRVPADLAKVPADYHGICW